jgi:hypothetical protein
MLSSVVLAEDAARARNYAQVMYCLEKPITKDMVEKAARDYRGLAP